MAHHGIRNILLLCIGLLLPCLLLAMVILLQIRKQNRFSISLLC